MAEHEAGNTNDDNTTKYQSHMITEDACDLRSDQAVLIQVQGFEFGVWSIQVSVNQAVSERRGSRKRAGAPAHTTTGTAESTEDVRLPHSRT